jgi:hypothetical protein
MKTTELAYQAGKKRQSLRTGFIHGSEIFSDTVSFYDNFCFVYALLAQRKTESILEAKTLLLRLLAFQSSEGNFPIQLHDYPRCYDPYLGLKIAPLLLRSLDAYGQVLGPDCRDKIDLALQQIFAFYADKLLPPLWDYRRQICLRQFPGPIVVPVEDLWEHWISEQFIKIPTCDFFFQTLGLVPALSKNQDHLEPVPHLIEWACASAAGEFASRLAKDHPTQVQLAALEKVELLNPQLVSHFLAEPFKLYWNDGSLHTLILVAENIAVNSKSIVVELPSEVEFGREDLYEVAFFSDAAPEIRLQIDGLRGTVFELGQQVQIATPHFLIKLQFDLVSGEGNFCGQIVRSNRPEQIACVGLLQHETFDWKIGLRTLRRSSPCTIQITYSIEPTEQFS